MRFFKKLIIRSTILIVAIVWSVNTYNNWGRVHGVKVQSIISTKLGDRLITKRPTQIVSNLSYFGDVDEAIFRNTWTTKTTATSSQLQSFNNPIVNYIDSSRMIRPIRVQFVPTKSIFTVVGQLSADIYRGIIFPNAQLDYYLLESSNGDIVELDAFSLDDFFERKDDYPNEFDQYDQSIIRNVFTAPITNEIRIDVCDYENNWSETTVDKHKKLIPQFITDFELKDRLKLTLDTEFCSPGIGVIANDVTAAATFYRYANDWGIYGIKKTEKPEIDWREADRAEAKRKTEEWVRKFKARENAK